MTVELGKVSYSSLNNIAYDQILRALREGKFQEGDSLRTRELAQALGISSTPVREALSRLIAQNALDVAPSSRAALVPRATREWLEELYSIRRVLDDLAVRAAAHNITRGELAKLRTLAADLDALEGRGESSEFLDKSEEFFLSVFAAAKRPILFNLLDNLWLRSAVILGLLSKQRPKGFSISVHRNALVDALVRRDADAAALAMDGALVATRNMVFDLLDQKGSPAGAQARTGARKRGRRMTKAAQR